MGEPDGRVKFYDEGVFVAIENETGQTVIFPVDEPTAGRLLRGRLSEERGAQVTGRGDFILEPFSPDGDWFTRLQDPHADGRMGIE